MNDIGQRDLPRILTPNTNGQIEPTKQEITLFATNILWIFGSWVVIILNIMFVLISIKDMINTGYSSTLHWACSSAVVATLGGLIAIHTFIIRK